MKDMLIIRASEDVKDVEVMNIASQIALYNINAEVAEVADFDSLYKALNSGKAYDYIYLASHGCETSFGNISGSVNVSWLKFAALVCSSGVAKPGAVFMHSCCRGGLTQVAWQMFACCPKVEYVCGPRHNVYPVDLITAFNLFLYNVEVKRIDPVRSAEKVLAATDIRLACFDSIEANSETGYTAFCDLSKPEVRKAFQEIFDYKGLLSLPATGGVTS